MLSAISKKTVVLAICVVSMMATAPASYGYITLNLWSLGAYGEFGGSGDYVSEHLAGTLWQALWSPDSVISELDQGSAMPTGGELVLLSGLLDANGQIPNQNGITAEVDVYFDDDPSWGFANDAELEAGYVYLRVFDQASPGVNDHYISGSSDGIGVALAATSQPQNPAAPGDDIDMTSGSFVNLDMTIVPEPGTFALFGLGLATLAMRRRFRK